MARLQCPQSCPGCTGKLFVEIRMGTTVGVYGARSRPAFKCANSECELRFDGEQWTTARGDVFAPGSAAA